MENPSKIEKGFAEKFQQTIEETSEKLVELNQAIAGLKENYEVDDNLLLIFECFFVENYQDWALSLASIFQGFSELESSSMEEKRFQLSLFKRKINEIKSYDSKDISQDAQDIHRNYIKALKNMYKAYEDLFYYMDNPVEATDESIELFNQTIKESTDKMKELNEEVTELGKSIKDDLPKVQTD